MPGEEMWVLILIFPPPPHLSMTLTTVQEQAAATSYSSEHKPVARSRPEQASRAVGGGQAGWCRELYFFSANKIHYFANFIAFSPSGAYFSPTFLTTRASVFRQVGSLFRQVGSLFRQGILPCDTESSTRHCCILRGPRASTATGGGTAAAGSGRRWSSVQPPLQA